MTDKINKGTIVIVDDISSHLLLLQSILEEEGYHTLTFSDPKKALELLDNEVVHVMLLDIMMPGIDGFEMLDKIKNDPKISDIHVLIISAKTDSWSIKNAMDKGAFDYLTKPINIHDLKNKVRTAMNEKHS